MRTFTTPVRGKRTGLIAGILAVVIAIGILGGITYYSTHSRVPQPNQALNAAQTAIRQRLGEDVMANFSPLEWTRVEALPGNKYYISGWLQAVSQNGQAQSLTYTCTLSRTGGTWIVEKLDLVNQ
jgi:hypothetical protein